MAENVYSAHMFPIASSQPRMKKHADEEWPVAIHGNPKQERKVGVRETRRHDPERAEEMLELMLGHGELIRNTKLFTKRSGHVMIGGLRCVIVS